MSPLMYFAFIGYRQIGRNFATEKAGVTAEKISILVGATPFATQFVNTS